MYAPVSLGRPNPAGVICVAGAVLGGIQGVGFTRQFPLVAAALSVDFSWHAQYLVAKVSGVRAGVAWSPQPC